MGQGASRLLGLAGCCLRSSRGLSPCNFRCTPADTQPQQPHTVPACLHSAAPRVDLKVAVKAVHRHGAAARAQRRAAAAAVHVCDVDRPAACRAGQGRAG